MPSKKKKYNARFPAGRIKKIMQSDEEIGKVAQAVPVIISRTLELFVESLLNKTVKITNSRNAKTLSTSHMKQCIMSEQRFDFLRELVKNIPDISVAEEAAANYNDDDGPSSPDDSDTPYDLSLPSTSLRASRTAAAAAAATATATTANGIEIGWHGGAGGDQQQNGATGNRAHLKRSFSSVIRHTSNAVESNQAHYFRDRLKQASGAGAVHVSGQRGNNNNNNSNSNNNNNNSSHSAPKRMIHENQVKHTAIPAPIVSYDFYNKPVVKIDYSNLPAATAALARAAQPPPHSAPADMASAEAAFNFSASGPVINIDLSNIGDSAVASISIGAIPTTSGAEHTKPAIQSASNAASSASGNSKNPASVVATVTTTTNKSSFFELDEDYDNI